MLGLVLGLVLGLRVRVKTRLRVLGLGLGFRVMHRGILISVFGLVCCYSTRVSTRVLGTGGGGGML